jgi:hypothetical protein
MIGVRLAEGLELVRRARIFKAAPGIEIGQHHDLLRREDLGGVGHELHAAKRDHLGVSPPAALRESSSESPTKSAMS